jgi:hypothetical protein
MILYMQLFLYGIYQNDDCGWSILLEWQVYHEISVGIVVSKIRTTYVAACARSHYNRLYVNLCWLFLVESCKVLMAVLQRTNSTSIQIIYRLLSTAPMTRTWKMNAVHLRRSSQATSSWVARPGAPLADLQQSCCSIEMSSSIPHGITD